MKKISKVISVFAVFSMMVLIMTACQKTADESSVEPTSSGTEDVTETGMESSESVDSEEKTENSKISIILDWTPNTNHTGLFVAKDKGFFQEAGLDVEIMQPPEGSTTQLVGSGRGQFGISFQDTLAKNFTSDTPVPVTAVAAILQHNTSGVISLKDSGIETPKDMSGKRYSTWDDPIELAMLEYVVNNDGGDFNSVVKVPFSENVIAQLKDSSKNGSDSAWIYYAWDGIAFQVNDIETNFIAFADYGEELDYYTPVLIANNDYLETNEDEAKKVVQAIKKGYEYAIANPEEAADILVSNAPELDRELVIESQKWINEQYIADAESFGYIDADRWNLFYEWLYENQLIEKEIGQDFGFTNEFIK